jgi:hypothetical protein
LAAAPELDWWWLRSEAHGDVGDDAGGLAAFADGRDLVFVGDAFPGELGGTAIAAGFPVGADDGGEYDFPRAAFASRFRGGFRGGFASGACLRRVAGQRCAP